MATKASEQVREATTLVLLDIWQSINIDHDKGRNTLLESRQRIPRSSEMQKRESRVLDT